MIMHLPAVKKILSRLTLSAGLILFGGLYVVCPRPASSQSSLDALDKVFDQHLSTPDRLSDDQILSKLNKIRSSFFVEAQKMSLQDCLLIGLRQNVQLVSAYESIKQYQYQKLATQLQNLPTLSVDIEPLWGRLHEYTSTEMYQSAIPITLNGKYEVFDSQSQSYTITRSNAYYPYLTLDWAFFQPANWAQASSASSLVAAQKLAFDVTARSVILNIQQSYFQLQASKALVDAYEKIYKLNAEQVIIVESKFNSGLVDIGVVEQAKTQLYSQTSQLISYYQKYLQDAASLSFQMNSSDGLVVLPIDNLEQSSSWALSLPQTISQALELREEIKKYIEMEKSYIWQARAAIRKYLPVFSFQVNYDGEIQKGKYQSSPLPPLKQKYTYDSTTYGIYFSWDIFDGGVSAAEASGYRAQARQQKSDAEYQRLKVLEQIRQTYGKYKTSNLNAINSTRNLEAAKASYAVQIARFNVGLSDMTSIIQSIQLLGDAIETKIEALRAYNQSIAELYRYSAEWPDGMQSIISERFKHFSSLKHSP